MQVRCYYNLHREEFSIQHKVEGRWLVRDYADEITLKDVTFKVSEAGRQRVIQESKKNVHAFVIGTLVDDIPETPVQASYNPYEYDSFVEKETEAPVHTAAYARLKDRQVQIARGES